MAARGRKKELSSKTPPGPKPEPPDFMTDCGRSHWDKYSDTINQLGLLESIDDYSFAMLCDAMATLEDMRRQFAQDGDYTNQVGENGALQINPICQLIAQQSKAVLTMASEFGMTPRGRINLTGSLSVNPDAAALDPFEQLMEEITTPLVIRPIAKTAKTKSAKTPGKKVTSKRKVKKAKAKPKASKR